MEKERIHPRYSQQKFEGLNLDVDEIRPRRNDKERNMDKRMPIERRKKVGSLEFKERKDSNRYPDGVVKTSKAEARVGMMMTPPWRLTQPLRIVCSSTLSSLELR